MLSKAPTITLFQLENAPTADLLRRLITFAALPFTEVTVSQTNSESESTPKVLPALRIDGTTVAELGPVCRRIAAFVGLHGASPHEDAYVDTLGGQILDLWDGILSATKESSRLRKLNDAMAQLNGLVSHGKNGKLFLVGKSLSWADLVLVYFVEYVKGSESFQNVTAFKETYPSLDRFAAEPRPENTLFDLY